MQNDNNLNDNNNNVINKDDNIVNDNINDSFKKFELRGGDGKLQQENGQEKQENGQEKQTHKIEDLDIPLEKFNRMTEVERLKIEKSKKEVKKEIKTDEKNEIKTDEKNEIIINDYNFIISHNIVLFVDSITKKEKEAGGKYCFGKNYQTGETVQILDKDYGKSPELMRYLLEDEIEVPLWKKILLFSIIFFVLIIVVIIVYSIFIPKNTDTKITANKNISNQIIPGGNNINNLNEVKPDLNKPITFGNSPNGMTPTQPIQNIPTQSGQVLQTIPATTIYQDSQLSIENMKKDYEIESLRLEYDRLTKENTNLIEENKKILTQNLEKDGNLEKNRLLIEDLQKKLKEYTDIPKNLSQEAFIINLGTQIYNKCEKSNLSDIEKQNCKELYYNYVTK